MIYIPRILITRLLKYRISTAVTISAALHQARNLGRGGRSHYRFLKDSIVVTTN